MWTAAGVAGMRFASGQGAGPPELRPKIPEVPRAPKIPWVAPSAPFHSKDLVVKKAEKRLLGPQLTDKERCFNFCPPRLISEGVPCADRGGLKRTILNAFGPVVMDTGATFLITDDEYYLPTVEEVQQILCASVVSRLAAAGDRFDCDDFAFGVKGEVALCGYVKDELKTLSICFGVIMGVFEEDGNHTACFFVAHDPKTNEQAVHVIEPRLPWKHLRPEEMGTVKPEQIPIMSADYCKGWFFIVV
jgi:hypothetical protein